VTNQPLALGVLDRKLGNRSYWEKEVVFKTPSEGVALHVHAAFHPSLDTPGTEAFCPMACKKWQKNASFRSRMLIARI
jgi:hypothetical protein